MLTNIDSVKTEIETCKVYRALRDICPVRLNSRMNILLSCISFLRIVLVSNVDHSF